MTNDGNKHYKIASQQNEYRKIKIVSRTKNIHLLGIIDIEINKCITYQLIICLFVYKLPRTFTLQKTLWVLRFQDSAGIAAHFWKDIESL